MIETTSLTELNSRQRWKMLTADADPVLVARYEAWIKQNIHVFSEFYRSAKLMQRTGRTNYSGWIIANKMRWESDLQTEGDDFKINNDFIGLMVRQAIAVDPSLRGFFSLRSMTAHRRHQCNTHADGR